MMTLGAKRLVVGIFVVAMVVAGASQAGNNCTCSHEYDAALGTLPSDQGWNHYSNGLPESNFSVVSGCLVQGSTGADANVQGYQSDACEFDFTDDMVTATATLRIITSTTGGVGSPRAGWGIEVTDEAGLSVFLFVAEDEVFLLGLNTEMAGPLAMDTTDDFHVYELVVSGIGATLWIDNADTGLALVPSQFRTEEQHANTMLIGDLTILQNSSSELKEFGLCVDSTVPVTHSSWGGIKAQYFGE